ncbi:hypothetical protein L7F22_044602 [Adiantum nelumboides]|nr:hypothetical protein [Adiantum nelumboides]
MAASGSSNKEEYYIKKFDGTNFAIRKQHMHDVMINKGLIAPLRECKEDAYTDDQWEDLNERAMATICLHIGETIYFMIMDKTTVKELWDALCAAWDGKSSSNKVFLMKKLMCMNMKKGSSVSLHLNEFNNVFLQLTSKGLNFDDEMKAIFLLCSFQSSWKTFNIAISNSAPGETLVFNDVTSTLFIEEI